MGINWCCIAILVAVQYSLEVNAAVDQEWMKDVLTMHFSKPRHHVSNRQYKKAATEFIHTEMQTMGLHTYLHHFPTVLDHVQGANVIGVLKGRDFGKPNDSVIAIGAHYDTVRNSPGVDDNGSGVVAMLQAAREITQHPQRNSTVLFIAFDFGEYENRSDAACLKSSSLCGSRNLVSQWLPKFFKSWPAPWKGMMSMDTVLNFQDQQHVQNMVPGYGMLFPAQKASMDSDNHSGDFLSAVGRVPEDSNLLALFEDSWSTQGEPQYEIEVFDIPTDFMRFAPDLKESLHYAFWEKNLSAVYLSDTAFYRGYMKKCYHAPCDSLAHVTDARIGFLAKVTRAAITWVDKLAAPLDVATGGTVSTASQPLPKTMTMMMVMTTISFILISIGSSC